MPEESELERRYPEHPIIAVGAVVFHDNHVLLVKRRHPPNRDFWTLPGGKVELGETLQQAVEREILEETGIRIKAKEPIYTFELIEHDNANRVRYHYVIIDFTARYLAGIPRAADDAAAAQWISVEKMATLPINVNTRQLLTEKFRFGS